MDESTLTEMSLLADNRDALCGELCKFAVEIKIDKTQYSPWSIQLILYVWTAAIHQPGEATNAS